MWKGKRGEGRESCLRVHALLEGWDGSSRSCGLGGTFSIGTVHIASRYRIKNQSQIFPLLYLYNILSLKDVVAIGARMLQRENTSECIKR